MSYFVLALRYVVFVSVVHVVAETVQDFLLPYPHGRHGSHRGHRFVRECQPNRFGNLTHEEWPTHYNDHAASISDLAEVRRFALEIGDGSKRRTIYGHQVIVNNPSRTVSVVEPREPGGCELHDLETVVVSASVRQCIVAVNAGFYNVSDGACLGNVVSDGRLRHDAGGMQNAHFGMKEDGNLFFGYVHESENVKESFKNLVGGVVWLVRNGESYVDVSKISECPDAQSTATLQRFIDVVSARTAVGHDKLGRLVIFQVEGKTYERGVSLYEFAELLRSFGIVNAINLDGGGSSTVVVNGTVVNYPSDTRQIDNTSYGVARQVSTILCIHDIECDPVDCSGHGNCHQGHCYCSSNWHGSRCDVLQCGMSNCSRHGTCKSDGCNCFAGWHGLSCSEPCPAGFYGIECSRTCQCPLLSTGCSPDDGHCLCPPGYHGYYCESKCPYGTYGEGCRNQCHCSGGCFCNHITGSCLHANSGDWQAGQCFADMVIISRQTAVLSSYEYWLWMCSVISLAVIAAASIIVNIICCLHRCRHNKYRKRRKHAKQKLVSPFDDSSASELDSDNEYFRRTFGSNSNKRFFQNNQPNMLSEVIPLTVSVSD